MNCISNLVDYFFIFWEVETGKRRGEKSLKVVSFKSLGIFFSLFYKNEKKNEIVLSWIFENLKILNHILKMTVQVRDPNIFPRLFDVTPRLFFESPYNFPKKRSQRRSTLISIGTLFYLPSLIGPPPNPFLLVDYASCTNPHLDFLQQIPTSTEDDKFTDSGNILFEIQFFSFTGALSTLIIFWSQIHHLHYSPPT